MVFCNLIKSMLKYRKNRHNPYFNRWFSAISLKDFFDVTIRFVTILILIDGFLQLFVLLVIMLFLKSHNPYFNRWFSAIHGEKNV